jgi:hypothetical protein
MDKAWRSLCCAQGVPRVPFHFRKLMHEANGDTEQEKQADEMAEYCLRSLLEVAFSDARQWRSAALRPYWSHGSMNSLSLSGAYSLFSDPVHYLVFLESPV